MRTPIPATETCGILDRREMALPYDLLRIEKEMICLVLQEGAPVRLVAAMFLISRQRVYKIYEEMQGESIGAYRERRPVTWETKVEWREAWKKLQRSGQLVRYKDRRNGC